MVALCHGASDELKKDMFWMQNAPHHYPLFEPLSAFSLDCCLYRDKLDEINL
jgi:hypothetical protein